MLSALRIRDLAIVTELEVTFEAGLTVLTGETGSGKSILVTALSCVLGARANPDLVRSGADRAVVEALFEVGDDPEARARLVALGLPDDEQIVVQRTITASGRSRATINGQLATSAQLQQLAAGLVDISSQHEHHSLTDPTTHLTVLDAWSDHGSACAEMAEAHAAAVTADLAAVAARRAVDGRGDRLDLIRFQLAEIDRLEPKPGELEALGEEADRLQHAAELRRSIGKAEEVLYGRDRSVCVEVSRVEADLAQAVTRDPSLAPLLAQVAAARTDLEDAADQLGRYHRKLTVDPERLTEVEDRLQALRRLARRYGDLDAAIAQRAALDKELASIDDADAKLEAALDAARRSLREAGARADKLSVSRRSAARGLGRAIATELGDLGMGDAEVAIEVNRNPPGTGSLTHAGARLTRAGVDQVELLIAPNPGEPPKPLRRIASGGELSRALLATKRVLAGLGPVGTYVFDEVDSGVGGAVADAIGRKVAQVAAHHQVLCVTHLPQIACFGHAHLVVRKAVVDGRTQSSVRRLSPDERVEEIARMLGGRRVTDAARAAARDLIASAPESAPAPARR